MRFHGRNIFLLPVTLKIRNRSSRFPLVPPLKAEAVPTGSKLHRRGPPGRRVRHQAAAIKQPTATQIRLPNTNQVDLPILPDGDALDATIH